MLLLLTERLLLAESGRSSLIGNALSYEDQQRIRELILRCSLVALLVFVSACGTDNHDDKNMICALDVPRDELARFSVNTVTGNLETGLEDVCCDRALSMKAIEVDLDDTAFTAQYETTLYGYVPYSWIDTLVIELDKPGAARRFILAAEFDGWSELDNEWEGTCRYE